MGPFLEGAELWALVLKVVYTGVPNWGPILRDHRIYIGQCLLVRFACSAYVS